MNDHTHEHQTTTKERFVINERTSFSVTNPANETIATLDVVPRHGVLWLTNLWVHHEYRRKGLAKALLTTAIKRFGDKALYLDVWAYTNQPMSDEQLAAFYATFGFQATTVPGTMLRPVPRVAGGPVEPKPMILVGEPGPELYEFANGTVVRLKD